MEDEYSKHTSIHQKTTPEPPPQPKTSKPFIIAIEGIDGAGKATLSKALAKLLNASVISFPQYGKTNAAKAIEQALRNANASPWHMAQLFAQDRHEAISQLATQPGVVIIDRYVASNAAYLHAKTQYHYTLQAVEEFEYGTLNLPKPNLQILIDTPVDIAVHRAMIRAENTGGKPDANETDRELQHRVRNTYLQMAKGHWVSPWIVISPSDRKGKYFAHRNP